jgi:hypothetical protein
MAYNPFNIFRRNQKAIFAVVTVFIMFTFVLSSGLGGGADFFDWLPRWLGSKGKRGEHVATLDGTKIYESELSDSRTGLRYRRVIANRYMSLAAVQTSRTLEDRVQQELNRMSPEGQRLMAPVRRAESMLGIAFQNPQIAAQLQINVPALLQEMRTGLSTIISHPSLKNEDKDVARAKLAILAIPQPRDESFFVLAPNRTQTDLLNFMLWQKKADQLGIHFTIDDVKALVEREFFGYFGAESQRTVQKVLYQDLPGFTMDLCLKALAEEFRVRAAQIAVLGADAHNQRWDKTYGGFPSFTSPYDTFDFFREECSPSTFAAIPVPVANFIDRVPNPDPKDPELKKLYQQYNNEEPNPAKETPGFKEPRKVQVAWFSVNGSEPYYTQLAEERYKLSNPITKTGSLLTVPVFGIGAAYLGFAVAPTALPDALLESEYDVQHAQMHRSSVDLRWSTSSGLLLETSVVRPGNMALAAGSLGAQLTGLGNPFTAVAAVGTGPIAYEIRDRVKAGMPLILGAVPTLGMFQSLIGGEVAYRVMVPKAIPIDAYRATLLKDVLERHARELALEDVQKFIAEVNKLSDNGKAKDKTAAQEFINEFMARRGLKVQGNEVPQSEWTLEDDPALAPLLAAQRQSLRSAAPFHGMQQRTYVPFGEKFFWNSNPMGARTPASGTHQPMLYPTEVALREDELKTRPQFVFWRKAEEQSKPRLWSDDPSSEIHKDVVRAWKRIKARDLAKSEAEKLANTIKAMDKNSETLLIQNLEDEASKFARQWAGDPKAYARVEPFLIRGVTPLTTVADPTGQKGFVAEMFRPTMPGQLRMFQLPPSENMRYPTNEIGKTLLDVRTKEPKHTVVLPDAPKDTFYVMTLVKRELKSETDYKIEVSGGEMSERFGGPIVMGAFRDQSRRNAYLSVIGLLKKEFKFEQTDEQKKKLEEAEKRNERDL